MAHDKPISLPRRLASEVLGTYALVFAGTGAIVINTVSNGAITHPGIALTFGLIVMAMIYTVGPISGAHLNPAVSIGFLISGRSGLRDCVTYIGAQVIGATLASLSLHYMFGNVAALGATLPAGPVMQSFWLEVILTGLLMFVILCVSTGPKEMGLMAGIAIGGVIALEAMFAGPICGASMNPARSLAPAVVSGNLQHLWVYLTAPFLGSVFGVICWKIVRG